jgi:hypothetical protein
MTLDEAELAMHSTHFAFFPSTVIFRAAGKGIQAVAMGDRMQLGQASEEDADWFGDVRDVAIVVVATAAHNPCEWEANIRAIRGEGPSHQN